MKLFRRIVMCGALTGLFAGCADESPFTGNDETTGKGGLKISLSSSSDVETKIPRVRAGETYNMVTPPESKFKIRLSKTDGTYAKTWSSIEEFVKETEFSIGVYEVEAFYGEPSSQGFVQKGEASYEHSYYYGKEEDIIVKEGEVTEAYLFAQLANSAVIVEYTDEYKKYFQSWSTTLQTEGRDDVEIGDYEGLSYVTPGMVDIVMNAVLQNGNKVFLNPAAFMAEARHLYKITYTVHGGDVEDAVLVIKFNDDPEATHDIEVKLGELGNAEPPIVSPSGFENGEVIESQTGVPLPDEKEIQYNIIARGGLKSAKFKIYPADPLTSLGFKSGEIDLCQLAIEDQEALRKAGIISRGIYSRENMGNLNITEFCKHLSEGEYTVSFQVTDNFDQTSGEGDPVTLTISNVHVNVEIVSSKAMFGDGYADLTVAYDGPDPTAQGANLLSFQMREPTHSNVLVPVEILSISYADNTRSFEKKNYIYRVALPAEEGDYYYANLYFSKEASAIQSDHKVEIDYPAYDLEYDAFARKMKVRISDISGMNDDQKKKEILINRLRIFINNVEMEDINIDPGTQIITIEGLTQGQTYTVNSSLKTAKSLDSSDFMTTASVSTEEELKVPNGNFENLEKTYSVSKLNQGGEWATSSGVYYQNYINYTIKEPSGWVTTNYLTTQGSPQNTWFCQPSVFNSTLEYTSVCPGDKAGIGWGLGWPQTTSIPDAYKGFKANSGNSMVLRNVGWDSNGNVPDKYLKTGISTNVNTRFNNNPAPNIGNVSAGTLRLGSYSENGNGIIEGVTFGSRPSKLSGYYTYFTDAQDSNEKGLVIIRVLNEDGTEIASEKYYLEPSSELSRFDIPINYSMFNLKANKLMILISSSNHENEKEIKVTPYNSTYESYYHGATLTIDDLEFGY